MNTTSYITHPEDTLLATAAEIRKSSVSALKRIHRKWGDRKARPALASLSDHALREIGIHRSEIAAIQEEGIRLNGGRYYE